MKYKAIIFDLDGTLVHAMPEHRYTLVGKALSELGVAGKKEDINCFWFQGNRDEIIKGCFGVEPDEFWSVYQKHDTVELRSRFARAYDDVDFVEELKARGYSTGIVTGAPQHIADMEIGLIGQEQFDAIIIARSSHGIKSKPDPQGIEECLKQLGISKEQAVYVGNADEDILTARNAGVLDVLVLRGEHEFPGLEPTVTIHSLYELRKHI